MGKANSDVPAIIQTERKSAAQVSSCQDIFGRPKSITVRSLRLRVPELVSKIVPQLKSMVRTETPRYSDADLDRIVTLSKSYCTGASIILASELTNLEPLLPIQAVKTRWSIAPIDAQHIYLVSQDYYGKNRPLIIDPTIRQFFSSYMTESEMSQKEIPEIFIGSSWELTELFKSHFRTDLRKWDVDRVLREYRNTYFYPALLD